MSFNSLDQVIKAMQPPGREATQQYHQLQQIWQAVVEPQVAQKTRPLYIARQVLWVATANSVWAQTLSLQRYFLLKQLTPQLSEPLTDIRFSSAYWHCRSTGSHVSNSLSEHPSHISPTPFSLVASKTPQAAFQRWVEGIQRRSLPLCSQCHCPTPAGELQRWGVCALCASQRWQDHPSKS